MMQTIIWDFNGTVLDDVDICVRTINDMLIRRDLMPISKDRYLEIFDFPVIDYYRRAGFSFNAEPFDKVAAEYISLYHPTSLMADLKQGVMECLRGFEARGFKQILLSASNEDLLRQQTDALGITSFFNKILGLSDIHAKSKLEVALDWLEKNGLPDEDIIMIGDTTHDYDVAQRLDCRCILVCGGHNSKERLERTGAEVIDTLYSIDI